MAKYLSKLLKNYKRDERGSFSILLVVLFTSLVLIAGAGIDLVRFEAVRSSIQYNLDRAVLAAASMRAEGEPKDIVENYMKTVASLETFEVDMDESKTQVTVTGRRVAATASAELNTYFLRLAGIDTMSVEVASQASEEIPNLEISLVLDVSGSMGQPASGPGGGTKIQKLKEAANEFITTMITDAPATSVASVSIVPYAFNVTLPENMWNLYTNDNLQSKTRCAWFDESDYSDPAIRTNDTIKQLSYFRTSDYYNVDLRDEPQPGYGYYRCDMSAAAEIMPFSTSDVDLKAKINTLQANGSTASHIGTKWGVALLDSTAQGIATNLGSADAIGRPTAYKTAGVLKVMVVMTDGNNMPYEHIAVGKRKGPSDMYRVYELVETEVANCTYSWMEWYYLNYGWYSYYCSTDIDTEEKYVYYIQNQNNFLYYDVNSIKVFPALPGINNDEVAPEDQVDEGEIGFQERLDWQNVWERMAPNRFADETGSNRSDFLVNDPASKSDSQMLASCSAAKHVDRNIMVFSIAFEAPPNAQTLLKSCATSPEGHYYNAQSGEQIKQAFQSIAVTIQKLRLNF